MMTHTAIACVAAAATVLVMRGGIFTPLQAQPATGQRVTDLFKQEMADAAGRVLSVRLTERDPGNGSGPHRHPGSHTVGYILEGSYQVQIDNGPVRTLKAGEVFYEYPNALHAVSRNGSNTEKLKYLIIQVSDPSKPATVPEPTHPH
jgi:quercetin dioxygenase-like cupin family protein